jgi:hypothetical protein
MQRLAYLLKHGTPQPSPNFTHVVTPLPTPHLVRELPAGFLDRTGQRYGKLVVKRLKHHNTRNQNTYWLCVCDCGEPRTVEGKKLAQGKHSITQCIQCGADRRLQKMRSKKLIYEFTPAIDDRLRALYVTRRNSSTDRLPGLAELSQETGIPGWRLKRRAYDLGLTRVKERPWTEAEVEIVKQWKHLTPVRISIKLKEAGFARTETAVRVQRKRLKLDINNHGQYSATAVAYGFGLDGHAVTNWIKAGLLKAERRGTARKAGQQGGDAHLITRAQVREFIFAHPEKIDLGKVDQLWFLHVVSDGQVQMTRKVAKRGKRPPLNL